MNLFNTAILVTAAAAVTLLVKLIFKNKITPRGHMLMWVLVAAGALAVPLAGILPESEFSAKTYLPQSYSTTETVWVEPYENLDARGFGIEEQGDYYTLQKDHISMQLPFTDKAMENDFTATASRAKIENDVWAVGTAAVLLFMLAGNLKQRRRLRALPPISEPELLAELTDLKKLIGIRERSKIQLRKGADSTFLTRMDGQYVIALEDGYNEEERRSVLAHELTHLAHGDLIYNLISATFLAAFWWNPVIWLAFRRFRRDMEIYCDYDAVRKAGDKKGYARVLVKAAGAEKFIIGTTSFIGGEKEASARVKALAAFKKPKTWIAVVAVIALTAGCVLLVTNPKSKDPCTRYFRDMQAKSVEKIYIAKETGEFRADYIYIDDAKQQAELIKLFHSFRQEDFTEGEPVNDGDYDYRLYVIFDGKAGDWLELLRDEEAGEDMYCIWALPKEAGEEESEEEEDFEISGKRIYSPKLTALLKEDENTNLHMSYQAEAIREDKIEISIMNTEYDNPNPQLSYTENFRIERYTGNIEDDPYAEDKWESLPELKKDKTSGTGGKTEENDRLTAILDISGKYGKLEEGTYRITIPFTQKLQNGQSVTKEKSAVFSKIENRLRLVNWDFLLAQPDGELSEETIAKLNNLFEPRKSYDGGKSGLINMNTLPCFFTSEYSSPDKMHFERFLRYYPQFDVFQEWTPAMKEKFENTEYWSEYKKNGWKVDNYITPVKLYRPDVLNKSLEYYAGISIDDLRANTSREEWNRHYVPEIDRYVTFTSDAGGGQFLVEKAEKSGDTVRLTGETYIEKGSGDNTHYQRGTSVLTLKEKDGRYLIQSLETK